MKDGDIVVSGNIEEAMLFLQEHFDNSELFISFCDAVTDEIGRQMTAIGEETVMSCMLIYTNSCTKMDKFESEIGYGLLVRFGLPGEDLNHVPAAQQVNYFLKWQSPASDRIISADRILPPPLQ